jgi:flagellin-like protein
MAKRGISAIVASVLLILITIAGVAIIWGVILPMISDVDGASSENIISVDTSGGYTLYDENYKIACVQVRRVSSAEIEGLEVLFSVLGSSYSSQISKEDVPAFNQKKTYCFSLKNFGKPDTVTVVTLPEKEGIAITSIIPLKILTITAVDSIVGDGEGSPSSQVRYLGGDEPINLTGCGVLNLSGRVYRLMNDNVSTGTCFNITANNIVLDGNGKTIIGDYFSFYPEEDYSVYVKGYNQTTIKNIHFSRFKDGGIYLLNNRNNNLFNITINVTNEGVLISSSSNNTLANIDASSGFFGVVIDSGSNNVLTNITARGNAKDGVALFPNSNNNVLTDITSRSNGYAGISLSSSSNNNFTNVNVTSNTRVGINLSLSSNNNYLISSNVCNNPQENITCSGSLFIGSGVNKCSPIGSLCGITCTAC